MKRINIRKRIASFVFSIMAVLLAASLLLLCFPAPASSEEIYKFERMWPTLQQPWYFNAPHAVAVDRNGDIFVADTSGHRIQKFTSGGQFITKWGSMGHGDGQFSSPYGIAVDSSGFVYVADTGNYRIQKFTSDGTFVTKWGSQGSGNGQFNIPGGIAVDGSGYIFVADTFDAGTDTGNYRVQKFTSDGVYVSQWGGRGSGDGQFNFSNPYGGDGIAVDGSGFVYVTDSGNYRIQKFTSDGVFVTKWGSQGNCVDDSCNGQFGFDSRLQSLSGVTVDDSGFVYVADTWNHRIQKFTSDGQFVTKWGSFSAGDENLGCPDRIAVDRDGYVYVTQIIGIKKFTSDGQFVAKWSSRGNGDGQLDSPEFIAVDGSGDVYVSEYTNHRVQKFTFDGQFITKWGSIDGSIGNGPGQFSHPKGIAAGVDGYVYVVDYGNHRIQKFTSGGVYVSQWGSQGSGDGQFQDPISIAVDADGFVYVTDFSNNCIQKFDSNGSFVTKWGSPEFSNPTGIAVDGSGNVYVADWIQCHVWKFTSDGQFVAKWGSSGNGDGQFNVLMGIAVDSSGHVYVIDQHNNRIQKLFTSDGTFVTKWGAQGLGPGQFSIPQGIGVSPTGLVYVTDQDNNRVQVFRKVTTSSKNKAIIVAGGGPYSGNNLWVATQMSANFAYRTLTYQGYTKENIHYLTSANIDLDDNGVLDDVADDATNANLQNAITNWATGAEDVIVYLVDHGGVDSFRMSGNETLSAAQLSSWLNTLQNSITGKVIVIYDACESGSFVGDLMPPSDKSRIVIASTSPGESAYFVTQGSVSFSNYFWTHIFNGVNIKDAFSLTRDAIVYTTPYQNPLLDANGNGAPNEAEDLALVQNTYIGSGTVISGSAPVIGTVPDDQIINNTSSALLYADNVTDADGIARVWAVIRPPDYNQGGSYNPVQSLPSIDLMPGGGSHQYGATYDAFNITGTYQIAIYARDRIGNTSIPRITNVSVTNPLRRKAIIVAGGSQGDSLWPAIERGAKLSYDALRFQGYAEDDIYLLSPASIAGVTKPTVLATKDNLSYAITGWAAGNTQDVALYMIGMGDSGIFRINNAETVSAAELRSWLDTLQGTIPGVVTVVYDGPLSGSFLPLLKPPSGKKRIVLSSTGGAQPVYFVSNGNISFSRFFWGNVLNGASLWDAYINARRAMGFLCAGQTPLLDDNADGIATKSDGSVARNYILGFGITLAADDPLIGSVSPPQTLAGGTSATVWARDVTTTGTIDKVWALITPPGGNQTPLNVPVTSPPGVIELTYNASSSSYEGSYNGFSMSGQYDIAIYAMDTEGNISEPRTTTVTQSIGPDAYEDDNTREKASVIILNDESPQRHNFHAAGDEDWVKFYAVAGEIYEVKAGNAGPNADVVLRLYDGDGITQIFGPPDGGCPPENQQCPGDEVGPGEEELFAWKAPKTGIYYVRVKNYDPALYGTGTNYDLRIYRPTALDIGTITGIISSDLDMARITSAAIQAGLGSALSADGSFILKVEAGTVNLSVNVEGYNSVIVEDVVVQAGQETPVNISMVPLGSEFTIMATAGQNGAISCTPNPVNYGGNLSCMVSPAVGYQVDVFTVDGNPATLTSNQRDFRNVTANHTVNVTFKIVQFTITAAEGQNGAISCTPNPVNSGGSSTCTITPNPNYHVADVLVDGTSVGAVTSHTFSNVRAAQTIAATFAINTCTITATMGNNGSISCTPNQVNYGGSSTCTVTPSVGYQVDAFTVDGSPKTLTNRQYVLINVMANHTVNVTFKLASEHGDVNNDGAVDLADAILALQVISKVPLPPSVISIPVNADVNGDGKIGMPEVIYILQKVAGIRQQ